MQPFSLLVYNLILLIGFASVQWKVQFEWTFLFFQLKISISTVSPAKCWYIFIKQNAWWRTLNCNCLLEAGHTAPRELLKENSALAMFSWAFTICYWEQESGQDRSLIWPQCSYTAYPYLLWCSDQMWHSVGYVQCCPWILCLFKHCMNIKTVKYYRELLVDTVAV